LTASIGAFVSSFVVQPDVTPFSEAQRRAASLTSRASPRPRWLGSVPVYSLNARSFSRFAVSMVIATGRPSSIAAKLPSRVSVGRRQMKFSQSSYRISSTRSVIGTSLVVIMSIS